MWQGIRSEWVKYRRTAIPWILWLTPCAIAGIILMYGYPLRDSSNKWIYLNLFDNVGDIWYGALIVLIWGLIAGLAAHLDIQAERWRALRSHAIAPWRLYMSKLLVLIIQTLLSTVWLLILLHICMGLLHIPFSLTDSLALCGAILIGWIASLPILAASLWLAVKFDWPVAVGFGSVGILIAAIIGTTHIGNGMWIALPWTWAVRAAYSAYFAMEHSLPGGDAVQTLQMVLPAAACSLLLLAVLAAFWFQRREAG